MGSSGRNGGHSSSRGRGGAAFKAVSAAGVALSFFVMATSTALYGGVLYQWTWPVATAQAVLLALCAAGVALRFGAAREPLLPDPLLRWSAVSFCLFALLVLLQCATLPEWLLSAVAPDSKGLRLGGAGSISVRPSATRDSLAALACAASMLLAGALFAGRSNRIIRIFSLLTAFGGIVAAYALFNYLTREALSMHFPPAHVSSRARGPFVNPNNLAAMMSVLLCAPFLLIVLQKTRQSRESMPLVQKISEIASGISRSYWKILAALCFVFMALAMTFSLSRGGIISGVAAVIVFVASFNAFRVSNERTGAWKLAAYCSIGFVLAAAALWIGLDPVLRRYASTEITDDSRVRVWAASMSILADNPVFGTGLGTYADVSPAYLPPALNARYEYAHNDFINLLTETGAVGTLLFLAGALLGIAGVVRSTLKHRLKRTRRAGVSAALAAAAAAAVASVPDFPLKLPAIAAILMFMIGAGVSGIRNQGSSRRRRRSRSDGAVAELAAVAASAPGDGGSATQPPADPAGDDDDDD